MTRAQPRLLSTLRGVVKKYENYFAKGVKRDRSSRASTVTKGERNHARPNVCEKSHYSCFRRDATHIPMRTRRSSNTTSSLARSFIFYDARGLHWFPSLARSKAHTTAPSGTGEHPYAHLYIIFVPSWFIVPAVVMERAKPAWRTRGFAYRDTNAECLARRR